MKHFNEKKANYMQLAASHGLTVDCKNFPPSRCKIIKGMHRDGLVIKTRRLTGWGGSNTSIFKITSKGLEWLAKRKIPLLEQNA